MWIRVDSDAADAGIAYELADAIGVKPMLAFGCYVALLGKVAQHRPTGLIADVPDALLEAWSHWPGRSGVWAAAVRARCQDEAGLLRGWWRNDAIVRKQLKDNAKPDGRKRGDREEIPPESRAGFSGDSARDSRGDEDGDVNGSSSPPSGSAPARAGGPLLTKLVNRLAGHPLRFDVEALVDATPASHDPNIWAAIAEGCLDGNGMPGGKAASVEQLVVGWRAYLLRNPDRPAEKLFRSCVANANVREAVTPALNAHRSGKPSTEDRVAAIWNTKLPGVA